MKKKRKEIKPNTYCWYSPISFMYSLLHKKFHYTVCVYTFFFFNKSFLGAFFFFIILFSIFIRVSLSLSYVCFSFKCPKYSRINLNWQEIEIEKKLKKNYIIVKTIIIIGHKKKLANEPDEERKKNELYDIFQFVPFSFLPRFRQKRRLRQAMKKEHKHLRYYGICRFYY